MGKPQISPIQAAFVHAYIESHNATDAVRAAGYKCKTDKAASVQGSRLLANVRIQTAIREAMEARERATMYDGAWIIAQVAKIAEDEEQSARDRLKALELMGKRYGLWEPKAEEARDDGVRVRFEEEIEAWAE